MIGPKEKKERSLGERLGLKADRCKSPKCALVRKPYRPGAHGQGRVKALSDFGRQIKEKTKFKLTYGMDERNLRMAFEKAAQKQGSTAVNLMATFESRIDNTVYRLGIGASRLQARQLVNQGHIMVNGRKVKSPGFSVKKGDTISIRPESINKNLFKDLKERLKKQEIPSWLSLDREKVEGKVLSVPTDVQSPFEINLLVESFSK